MIDDVREFHEVMGVEDVPRELRCAMVEEEAGELCAALRGGDPYAVLLEAVDLVYVTLGALRDLHFTDHDFDTAWREVHRANLTKIPSPTGKIRKPPGFEPVTPAGIRKLLTERATPESHLGAMRRAGMPVHKAWVRDGKIEIDKGPNLEGTHGRLVLADD